MKRTIFKMLSAALLCGSCFALHAQDSSKVRSSGDLFNGLTKKVTYNQMITPYGIEVSFLKTVHIVFPAAIRYVDLGSTDIIAAKADGAENVLRVKSAVEGFRNETNFSVITEEGSFYSFNVKYAREPEKLNIEMKDLLHEAAKGNSTPETRLDVNLKELGAESAVQVKMIMQSIYDEGKPLINHIGSKKFSISFMLKSIYVQNNVLYFHTQVKNNSNLNYDIDLIRFKIVDKKVPKRTAIQETIIDPLRSFNNLTTVNGKSTLRTVYAFQKFTIPDSKMLVVELFEKNGGRHQRFAIENENINQAKLINELKLR